MDPSLRWDLRVKERGARGGFRKPLNHLPNTPQHLWKSSPNASPWAAEGCLRAHHGHDQRVVSLGDGSSDRCAVEEDAYREDCALNSRFPGESRDLWRLGTASVSRHRCQLSLAVRNTGLPAPTPHFPRDRGDVVMIRAATAAKHAQAGQERAEIAIAPGQVRNVAAVELGGFVKLSMAFT